MVELCFWANITKHLVGVHLMTVFHGFLSGHCPGSQPTRRAMSALSLEASSGGMMPERLAASHANQTIHFLCLLYSYIRIACSGQLRACREPVRFFAWLDAACHFCLPGRVHGFSFVSATCHPFRGKPGPGEWAGALSGPWAGL